MRSEECGEDQNEDTTKSKQEMLRSGRVRVNQDETHQTCAEARVDC